jgi:solute:Na+ symporter, SSS family
VGAFAGYAALYAFIANLVVATVLSLLFNAMKVSNGKDTTTATDYEEQSVAVGVTS